MSRVVIANAVRTMGWGGLLWLAACSGESWPQKSPGYRAGADGVVLDDGASSPGDGSDAPGDGSSNPGDAPSADSASPGDPTNQGDGGDGPSGPQCGNQIIEMGEVCEVGDLDGKGCTTIGGSFNGGDLACNPVTCQWDTSGCTLPVCWGPANYAVSSVRDHYPCNSDSDCVGECLWEQNVSLNTKLGFCDGAPAGYPQSSTIDDVALGDPCYLNRDCVTGYCWWGRGISTRTRAKYCVFPCALGDSHDDNYLCTADPDITGDFACAPISGSGLQGSSCKAAEYDCQGELLCLHNFCTRLGCDTSGNPCPGGSSCLSVEDENFGARAVCAPDAALGTLTAGEHCLHNVYCSSNNCSSNTCL